jgi:hypothetical protein
VEVHWGKFEIFMSLPKVQDASGYPRLCICGGGSRHVVGPQGAGLCCFGSVVVVVMVVVVVTDGGGGGGGGGIVVTW